MPTKLGSSPAWNRLASDRDLQMYIVIAVVAIVAWWPTRMLPYHWDAASFIVEAARDFRAEHFWPPITTRSDFAHPTFFPELLALVWTVFGERPIVTHVFLFFWLPAVLLATYQLGKASFGRGVGAAAALVFAATPVALEEYGQVYMDLPLAAFITAAIWAWGTRRPALTALLFSLAAATKIPPIIVPAVLFVSLALDPARRREVRMYAALVAPFLVVAVWLAYHRWATGWLLSLPSRRSSVVTTLPTLAAALQEGGKRLFVAQGRLTLLLAGLIALVIFAAASAKRTRDELDAAFWRRTATLLAIPVVAWVGFSEFGELAQRYCLFVLPSFYLGVFALVQRAATALPWTGPATTVGVVAALTIGGELSTLHPHRVIAAGYQLTPDEDLGARDVIKVGMQAAQWVRANDPEAHVYGAFPETYQLTEPYQGYVDTPELFTECADYGTGDRSGRRELVYIHPYSPGQIACAQLAEATHAVGIKLFRANGHWIEIRQIPHSGL